jgi:hypothetical protein
VSEAPDSPTPSPPIQTVDTVDAEWVALSARVALASHRLVGWVYWDPVAIERYTDAGVPNGFGYYVTSRAAPLLEAGPQVVAATFGTISPVFIEACVGVALAHTTPAAITEARNSAVADGLRRHAPEVCATLADLAPGLWEVVDRLPSTGRALFAAHRGAPRPDDDDVLSGWLGVNCVREWRGDTHMALLAAAGIGPVAAGILDDARRNYGGWIPRSRGADDAALDAAWRELEARGWATGGAVNDIGLAARAELERRTDELSALPWQLLGIPRTLALCEAVEPVGEHLVARIDATAGPQWMPAARDLDPTHPTRAAASASTGGGDDA